MRVARVIAGSDELSALGVGVNVLAFAVDAAWLVTERGLPTSVPRASTDKKVREMWALVL